MSSAAAFERVAAVDRLLPMVLLRDDPRVQAAYRSWWARMVEAEAGGITDAAAWRSLQDDATLLFALIRSLGLERYGWLPMMLRFEFQLKAEENAGEPTTLEITLPPDLPSWDTTGKRPKSGPSRGSRRKTPEGSRLKRLALELGVSRSDVQHACHRARLLDCINAPMPDVDPA